MHVLALEPLVAPQDLASGPWLVPLLLLAVVGLLAAVVFLLARVASRLEPIEKRLGALERLEEIGRAAEKLTAGRDDLDLRRMEHVLIDIRDGQRRVEDGLLAAVEGRHALEGPDSAPKAGRPVELADRVVTRLLALGYERVLLVTPHEDLAKLVEGDGEVVIEARRDGAICKGRVRVRGGRITDVQIQPAYSTFP